MLSISVAVYNLPDITRQCFESLERTLEGAAFEVLVHDNHSTDPGMPGLYAALDPARFKVVRAGINSGYRGAHRENAARFAGDWFVIINNDIVFEERGWNRKLVLKEGIGAVGVTGGVCNALAENGAGYYDPRAAGAPMYVDGHFMAIPRAVLLKEGLFEDEQIGFCYFEDSDHSFTLRQKGYGFDFIPVGLTHFRGSTVRSLPAEERLFLLQAFEHNRARFLAKWSDEIRRLRAALNWDSVDLGDCPRRPSPQMPVTRASADLITRGLEDHKAGNFASAEALYRKALTKGGGKPVPAAENFLAVLMMDTARPEEAVAHARRAVGAEPGNAFYRATLGNAQQAAGHIADAFSTYFCAQRLNPLDEVLLYNLGRLCLQDQMPEEAADFYRKAIAIAPAMFEAQHGLGQALTQMGQIEAAVATLRPLVEAYPAQEDAALDLSLLYLSKERYDEAEAVLRTVLAHRPGAHALHNNLGVVLHKKGDPRGARAEFAAALRSAPSNPEYLSNAGLSLAADNDLKSAIAVYRRAIAIASDYPDAHWNLALALLLGGDYLEGWREYRWGLRTKKPRATPRRFERPAWEGSDLAGKRILLYAEQGYGDTFQFVRYARLLKERGAEVLMQCQRGLRSLISDVPGVDRAIEESPAPLEFDLHCSIFDAPRLLGTTVDTIPWQASYLRAEARLVEKWRDALAGLGGLKVGLAWQGRAAHEHDRLRSIPLGLLEPLLQVQGVSFVSLQKGHGSGQIAASAFAGRMADYTETWDADGPDLFLDAAGVLANLDLVITVDSAIAHLAGAMGRPVWTFIQYAPDWRWMLGRDDTPWYPSMRLFRQTAPGDWEGPIARAASMLTSFFR